MTLPPSRTVTVRHTSLPSTGYSIRLLVPAGRLAVRWTVSVAPRTFLTTGLPIETVRLVGTLYSEKVTYPLPPLRLLMPRMSTGYFESFVKLIVWRDPEAEMKTVESRPSG